VVGRRELLIGAACLAGAGAAQFLKPHKAVSLLGKDKLADILPASFGGWTSKDTTDLVAPVDDDSLASRLYEQTLGRIYDNASVSGPSIMMLTAHGALQTNELSFHRPELCYPAAGFTLSQSHTLDLPLGAGVTIPVRCILADAPARRESIVYWSRIGEYLPTNSAEQRADRMKTAFEGYVPDGLLARFSAIGANPEETSAYVQAFIQEILHATSPGRRAPLIGTVRTAALKQANV
jgi:EpsI family protein